MVKRKRSSSISKKIQIKPDSHICMCCGYDSKNLGWLFVIVGILYLLVDLGWNSWWNISWYTILFLIFGIKMVKNY